MGFAIGLSFAQAAAQVLIPIAIIAAALYGGIWSRCPPGPFRTVIKALPMTAMALLALFIDAPALLTIGFALSALGDAALSRAGNSAFRLGLAAFLAAHLAYIALFVGIAGPLTLWHGPLLIAAFLYAATIARWLLPHLGKERFPVLLYIAVIAMMGAAASLAPLAYWPVMLGAGLFILSDTILAAEIFVFSDRPKPWTGPAIWFSYSAAQGLIAAAFLAPILNPVQ